MVICGALQEVSFLWHYREILMLMKLALGKKYEIFYIQYSKHWVITDTGLLKFMQVNSHR